MRASLKIIIIIKDISMPRHRYGDTAILQRANFPNNYKEVLKLAMDDVRLPNKVALASQSVNLDEAQKGLELVLSDTVGILPFGQLLEEASPHH